MAELQYGLTGDPGLLGQLILVASVIYLGGAFFLKYSLAFFFLRIVTRRWQRVMIHLATGVYAIITLVLLFSIMFEYGVPTKRNVVGSPHISPTIVDILDLVHGSCNFVLDWILVLTAIPMVNDVQRPRRDKVSIACLIALGAVGSIVSVARVPFMHGLFPGANKIIPRSFIPIAALSSGESSIGMIAISLATLRPLFRRARTGSASAHSRPSRVLYSRAGSSGGLKGCRIEIVEMGSKQQASSLPTLPPVSPLSSIFHPAERYQTV